MEETAEKLRKGVMMMDAGEIRVSVIVPVYNVEDYLERALDSLVSQTLPGVEIICVNDASSDGSMQILLDYEKRYPQIRVLSNDENKGQSYSRNRAIRTARGKYIQFVDADDSLDPDTLEILYDKAEKYSLDLLRFNYHLHDNVHDTPYINLKHYSDYTENTVLNGRDFFYELVMDRSVSFECYSWLNFLRREWVIENNMFFREGMIFEDILYTYRLLRSPERCMTINVKKYHYLLRPESTVTMTANERHVYGQLICINEVINEMATISDHRDLTAAGVFLYELEKNLHPIVVENRMYMDISGWEDEIVELFGALFRNYCFVNFSYVKRYLDEIKNAETLYIYGAGKACDWLLGYLKRFGVTPDAIVVSRIEGNPARKQEIRVVGIDEIDMDNDKCLWLSAVKKQYENVRKTLNARGYTHIIDTVMV